MTNIIHPQGSSGDSKPAKRSILGLLFNPQLGSSLSPLHDTTRIFLHLVAGVFAIYGLLPKTYPGLQDPEASLSFSDIIASAWQNVRFTREGAPRAILFFAILGIMVAGTLVVVFTLLSLFIGHAHAQPPGPNSMFTSQASNDIAQNWIDFLFNKGALSAYANEQNAVPTNFLQTGLTSVLAFYSDAILIIAALILFYHLTSMVVETAHHGVPMGKRASQIWAPIRLVVAIGLLVPINGGLSSGQFIVIKMAELGSGLATNAWNLFLTQLNSSSAAVPPNSPIMAQAAIDILADEACMYDYNMRVNTLINQGMGGLGAALMQDVATPNASVNGQLGTLHSFSTNDLPGQALCGSYFLPANNSPDPTAAAATAAEANALGTAVGALTTDAQQINQIMPADVGGANQPTLTLSPATLTDVIAYQNNIGQAMANLAAGVQSTASTAITQIQPYGWVFAGALMPMIEREQAMVSNAVTAGMPATQPPQLATANLNAADPDVSDIIKGVQTDLNTFNTVLAKTWEKTPLNSADAQCAAMMGLQNQPGGMITKPFDMFLGLVDRLATMDKVWTSGVGVPCANGNVGADTFQLGVNLTGADIIGQMVALGHDNIEVALELIEVAVVGKTLGGLGGALVGAVGGAIGLSEGGPAAIFGAGLGAAVGGAIGTVVSAVAGVVEFFAFVFFTCGFVLAFILPMFPFTRLFFAVLSWVGALIEAVIAIPLVALAHLNPEGDGLPGASARTAYYFIFDLFLFPVLTIFGLVAGLLIFMVAANFLTFAYSLAVAASGGTSYGHETLSKILYSVLYVATLYICANHAFAMIAHVPKNALAWMGARGQAMPVLGEAGHIAQTQTLVAGYLGEKGMGTISGTAGNVAQGVGKGAEGAMSALGKMPGAGGG